MYLRADSVLRYEKGNDCNNGKTSQHLIPCRGNGLNT